MIDLKNLKGSKEQRENYEIIEITGIFQWKYSYRCGLDIKYDSMEDLITVVVSDSLFGENLNSISISDMIAELATTIYHRLFSNYPVDKIMWVECYMKQEQKRDDKDIEELYAIINFDWDGKKFHHPKWVDAKDILGHIYPADVKNPIKLTPLGKAVAELL